jgi:hypothetical protein
MYYMNLHVCFEGLNLICIFSFLCKCFFLIPTLYLSWSLLFILFQKVLSTSDTNTDEEPVAYVLLLLAVANQIQSQPSENRRQWFHSGGNKNNIFSTLFTAINKCKLLHFIYIFLM